MKVIEYILLSGALTLPMMYTLRNSAEKVPLRLSRGLAVALLLALEQSLLALLGLFLGNMLRLGMPEYDKLVFLGILLMVAIRMVLSVTGKKQKKEPLVFDISRWGTVLLMGIATGTNAFLTGLGLGFIALISADALSVAIPLFLLALIFSYWGVMLGRQQRPVHPRRWVLLCVVALLVLTLKVAL